MKTYNIPVEATLEVIGGKWKVESRYPLPFKERNKKNERIKTFNAWYYSKNVNTTIT